VRNAAWGAAMVMAGLLAVIVADSIWMAYFRLDEAILSGPRPGLFCMFGCWDPWASLVELIRADSVTGLAVVMTRLLRCRLTPERSRTCRVRLPDESGALRLPNKLRGYRYFRLNEVKTTSNNGLGGAARTCRKCPGPPGTGCSRLT
jgi:hypothetical protein